MNRTLQKKYQVDPERPLTYVVQSRTPDSYRAFMAPEKPVIALNPPPDPKTAMTGTCTNKQIPNKSHYHCINKLTFDARSFTILCGTIFLSNNHYLKQESYIFLINGR